MVVLTSPTNRRPRMAQQQVSHVLARLKREPPLADFAVDAQLNQALAEGFKDDAARGIVPGRRDRLLTPLVTLRLFLTQILHGNVAITALRQLSGIDFAKSSYSEARNRLQLSELQ